MSASRPRILVVDDEPAVGRAIVEMLQRELLSCHWVGDASEALALLAFDNYELGDYDLVLTDLWMPKVGGVELLRAIEELDPALPVVLLADAGESEAAVEAVRARAFDLLWKPVDRKALLEVVRRSIVARSEAVCAREQAAEERARLERRSALLSVLFEQGSDGVLTWDAQGRLVDISPSVATLTGVELEQVSEHGGAPLFEREPFGGALEDRIAELARHPGAHTSVEVVVRTREGPAPARLTLTVCELPPAAAGEPPVCWVVGLLQPPRREALRRRLRRTDQLATHALLGGGIAHEIKNELGPLLTYLSILEGITAGDPELMELFTITLDCVRRIEGHVERILAPLRPQRPPQQRQAIGALVRESVSFLRRAGHERNLTIDMELDPQLPEILARTDDIHQIVVNLVSNAIEAGHAPDWSGRPLKIRVRVCEDESSRVVLEVLDNGPGIPPELQARVFEPFFTTRGVRGTGLGLTVVQDLVRELGGDLTIVSVPMIAGTCVRVSLPRADVVEREDQRRQM